MPYYDCVHISSYSNNRMFVTLYRGRDGLEIEVVMPIECAAKFTMSLMMDGFIREKTDNGLLAFYREYN